MSTWNRRTFGAPHGLYGLARLGLALSLLAAPACGLKEAPAPELFGPSELGLGISLSASPDIILANGFASSVIQARLQDSNGQPLAGRELVFTITDTAGRTADIGNFRTPASLSDLGTSVTVRTDRNGIAQVVYEAPARTDFTSNGNVQISVRPVGTDARSALYRSVQIELRSPEPRLFPENPDNVKPFCNFATQAPDGFRANTAILFQSTSNDVPDANGVIGTIVRYEWFFSDGTQDDKPDIAHVFRSVGDYTVTHVVTDNEGAQSACSATLNIR
jgi:hypothetical protein